MILIVRRIFATTPCKLILEEKHDKVAYDPISMTGPPRAVDILFEKAAFDPISINGITDYDTEKSFDFTNESDTKVEIKLEKEKVISSSNGFNCEKCGKRFVKERDFVIHMKCHERNPNADFGQMWNICNQSIPKKHFIWHLNSKHPSKLSPEIIQENLLKTKENLEKKIYRCRKCIYETLDEEMLKDHVSKEQHEGNLVNQEAYCPYCDKKFNSGFSSVKVHIDNKHKNKGDKNYFCDVCNKGFTYDFSYYMHNHIREKKEVRKQCEICDIKVLSLVAHRNEKHMTCCYCNWKTPMYNNWQPTLQFHIDSKHPEHGEKKFFCNLCPKSFIWEKNLKGHIRGQHNKVPTKHVCEICAIEYVSLASMNEHKQKEHPSPDATNFVCDVCAFSTFSSYKLKRHRYIKHEYEKHKVCPHCEFKSPYQKTMCNHIDAKHPEHGEKKFFCEYCGKGFIFKATLLDHPVQYCRKHPRFKGRPKKKVQQKDSA